MATFCRQASLRTCLCSWAYTLPRGVALARNCPLRDLGLETHRLAKLLSQKLPSTQVSLADP